MAHGRERRDRAVRRSIAVLGLAGLALGVALTTGAVGAPKGPGSSPWAEDQPGVQHLHFKWGPVEVKSGQNNIAFSQGDVPKPTVDGYIVGIRPNIRTLDGKVPPVDVIHLHHGVWLNRSAPRDLSRGSATFFAAGEEKTAIRFPKGYGYPYQASDSWTINYMIHNLTKEQEQVWITYDIDFVPATAPEAASITAARPIWMDVQRGSIYPVFDVIRGTGTDGTYTYPDQATDPYRGRPPKNQWTVDRDSVLLSTAGHLHPGGLHTDLYVDRAGAGTAHLFESTAKYFEPAGAVSWDVSMTATRPDWKVQVKAGDVLRINATYDTERASWYESMGIMTVWMADGTTGRDPFATKVDQPGTLTHGHLPENDNHGGKRETLPDITGYTPTLQAEPVGIDDYIYGIGDMLSPEERIPSAKAGQTITFVNNDAPKENGIWHSVTACKAPCNKETGIAYPLADGPIAFDSGQLGTAGPPTAGRITWQTPSDLPVGTYTYFCRIHPFMRGAFAIEQ